jgi:hypothetical protein
MPNPFEFLDDYLDKKLSITDNSLFEQNLNQNNTLANELRLRQQVRSSLKSVAMRQRIASVTADIRVEPTPSYRWLFVGSSIALVSIFVGFSIWKLDDSPKNTPAEPKIQQTPIQLPQPQNNEPRASVEPKKEVLPTTELAEQKVTQKVETQVFGSSDSIKYLIADATPIGYDAWQKDNSQWRGDAGKNDEQSYFEAYKNLRNGQVEKAKNAFKSLAGNTGFRNFRRAQWYLTLAELSQNPSPNNENLNKIINTNGHYFQQRAKSLKRFLEKQH